MTLNQFLAIFRARWILVVSVLAVVLLLAVVLSLVIPAKYTATSEVVIGTKTPDPITGAMMQNGMLPSYLATQMDVIRSDRVVQKVIRKLKLNESAEMRSDWQSSTDGNGVFESWLADLLLKHLDVLPSKESSVIDIEYTATDPRFASIMTNTFVQAYIDTTLELRVEPARRYSALFDEQAKQARTLLETAQTKLSDYQKSKGIVATDERLDVENARLVELSTQLVTLQTLAAESKSRRANAGANSQEVLNNPVIGALKADINRDESRLKELSARYGAAHPQVSELKASLAELRTRLDQEVLRVSNSIGINDTVNQSREATVRAALDAQREKLLRMKAQRDEMAVLVRDVENAQRSYDALQARYAQSSLESQSNQTDVSILKVATPPSEQSSPRLLLNIIIALVLGLFLGLNAAIVQEMRDRRIRSEEDMAALVETTLIGVMPNVLDAANKGKRALILGGGHARLGAQRAIPELAAPK